MVKNTTLFYFVNFSEKNFFAIPTSETMTCPEKNVKISGKNFFAMPTFG